MFNVSLRRLEVFLAVVEAGSFSGAGDRLDIAQPSVSAHIRALEKQIGGSVFERRRGSRPVLTDLGRSVEAHARTLLSQADDLRADVVNIRSRSGERLVLSCQRSLANFILKQPITHFALSRPDIQLTVRIGKQEDVVQEVRDGIADIGCFLMNDDLRGFRSQVIGRQRLRVVAAPTHPLAGKSRVRPDEVSRYGFVGPPPGSMFERAVTRLLNRIGVADVSIVAQATEYQFLRELVAANVGLSCSLERSVEADVASGLLRFVEVDAPDMTMEIRLITAERRTITRPMELLIGYLLESERNMPQPPLPAEQ